MLYFLGIMLAKTISVFVFIYTLYFLSIIENRKILVKNFNTLSMYAQVPLLIFIIIAFCVFIGNF